MQMNEGPVWVHPHSRYQTELLAPGEIGRLLINRGTPSCLFFIAGDYENKKMHSVGVLVCRCRVF